jgi:hypothetical protein
MNILTQETDVLEQPAFPPTQSEQNRELASSCTFGEAKA